MNKLVFINNTSTVDTGTAAATDPTKVPDQQIGIFDADNIAGGTLDLTGANATDRMIIVQGDDKSPFVSQVIEKDALKRALTKDYQAYINQVSHVGFNGVDAIGISVTEGDAYVKVVRLDKGFEQFPRATAYVKVLSSDTEYDVATKLAADFNAKDGAKAFVDAEVLVNQVSSELLDTANTAVASTLAVTEGSNIVVATVSSGTEVDASVGDFIRIGSATALTSPVYEITAIETNDGAETELEITLDRAYADDSATGVAAGTLDTTITTQEAGLQLTAKDLDEVSDFVESNAAIGFSTSVSDDFAGISVAVGTSPKTGSGTFAQVRDLERKFAGIQKGFYHRNYFPQTPEYFADDATNYDICTVTVELDNDNAVVKANQYLGLVFAYDTGASLATQLETFFGIS